MIEAESLFNNLIKNQFCEPHIVTCNTMIEGFCKIGNNFTAIALLRIMDRRGGCKPDIVSYNTIINSLFNDVIKVDDAFKLFKEMIFHKIILPNVVTYNSLISGFCKLGRWDEVFRMLKQMKDERRYPQVETFNIIVDALCKQGKMKEAEFVTEIMVASDGKYCPDSVTYNSLIDGYCLVGKVSKAKNVLDLMESRCVEPNVVSYNRLLDGYIKNGNIVKAYIMHNEMNMDSLKPKPNMVTNHIMRWVGVKHKEYCVFVRRPYSYDEWLEGKLYELLMYLDGLDTPCCGKFTLLAQFTDGIKLNYSTFSACSAFIYRANISGNFDFARRLFNETSVKGLQPDIQAYKVMIRGFCRRGLLKYAKQLFHKLEKTVNPLSLNIIVTDYIS